MEGRQPPKFRVSPEYQNPADALAEQKKAGRPTVLNIHFPGTGNPLESGGPNYTAMKELEQQGAAAIYFHGVGADTDIGPVQNAEDTLAIERKESKGFFKGLFSTREGGFGVSDPEVSAAEFEGFAKAGGLFAGAGEFTSNRRVMAALAQMEHDGILPERLFLSGYSRGAVNCVSLANEIYRQYGTRITIDLCLVDPVPGPGHRKDLMQQIVPPNVTTFNCLYAAVTIPPVGVLGKLIDYIADEAIDINRFIITNPYTTVTSYSVPNSTHQNICLAPEVAYAVTQMTYAANQKDSNLTVREVRDNTEKRLLQRGRTLEDIGLNEAGPFNPKDMTGHGVREKSHFYKVSGITKLCSAKMAQAINSFRGNFDRNFQPQNIPADQGQQALRFNEDRLNTPVLRKNFLLCCREIEQYIMEKNNLQDKAKKPDADRMTKIIAAKQLKAALCGEGTLDKEQIDALKSSPALNKLMKRYEDVMPPELRAPAKAPKR
jgi:hypothetical protein